MKIHTDCPVCGKTKFTKLFKTHDRMFDTPGMFTVKQCDQCKLLFLDPQPSYETLKKYYPSTNYYAYQETGKGDFFGSLRNYLIKHYYQPTLFSKLLTLIIPNVPAIPSYKKNGTILDIGCGTGDTLLMLQKLEWNVYGIDIDKKAVEVARTRGLKNVRVGTYQDVSKYPDHSFDAIRLYHVIEHLDDSVLALRIISKKLKKGGELILGTPNGQSLVARLFGKYWYNLDTPRHLYVFSPKSLRKLCEKERYSVGKIEYCSAGGIVGSLQYLFTSIFGKRIILLDKLLFVMIIYPIEWLVDKFRQGDIFVLRATTS